MFTAALDAGRDLQQLVIIEAGCRAHGRRELFELAEVGKVPIATEAVRRIDQIFDAERAINDLSVERRLTVRRERIAPFVIDLESAA